MKEMAFARHNIEKRRLIELVKLNPILWDCRLPQYKRSDKKKAVKWDELGRIFSVNGERVQRTFTSLREIFRREFNHEKMLGNRFKSKWEYYDAMAFLKEVIRERKPRERSKRSIEGHQQNHIKSHTPPIDEYQYFAPNDPNNPNNQQLNKPKKLQLKSQNSNSNREQQNQEQLLQQALQQSFQQNSPQNLLPQSIAIQPDVILSLNTNALNGGAVHSSEFQSQNQQSQQHASQAQQKKTSSPNVLSLSPSASSSPSIYIKDEPDSQDETISLATTTNENSILSKHLKSKKGAHNQISASAKKIMDSNSKNTYDSNDLIIDDDMLSTNADDDDPDVDLNDDNLSVLSANSLVQHQPTAREILYTKFGDFLAARLNTLNETVANDLMNKILLLIAEK